jgi:hypothetical protein
MTNFNQFGPSTLKFIARDHCLLGMCFGQGEYYVIQTVYGRLLHRPEGLLLFWILSHSFIYPVELLNRARSIISAHRLCARDWLINYLRLRD